MHLIINVVLAVFNLFPLPPRGGQPFPHPAGKAAEAEPSVRSVGEDKSGESHIRK